MIAPNNDPGNEAIFSALESLPKERFRQIPSMRFAYFSELMRHANVMVGNSSAGVREAPFLGLPSLDIGTRQHRRARSESITACTAFDTQVIDQFLRDAWGKRYPCDTSFGSGHAALSFVNVLSTAEFWDRPMQKVFNE